MRSAPLLIAAALLLGGAARAADLALDRAVISADAVWSGTVLLKGQNVVKRGATLTILPGTKVRFLWSDEDGDGIGDGELTVEGRLAARGTRDARISFASAREAPAPRDWTFVIVQQSTGSVLEYCVFEHAFTGVQVHFSTGAVVRDCLFRNNFEGLRFSTTEVLIEHNDFLDNGTAIRFEAHGSRAQVVRNRFRGNGYAFFPAQRSTSTARIAENDIEGSLRYQVSLGEVQRADLDFTGNWWGTADPAVIAASLYDRADDPLLGRIVFEPFLNAPVPGAGVRP